LKINPRQIGCAYRCLVFERAELTQADHVPQAADWITVYAESPQAARREARRLIINGRARTYPRTGRRPDPIVVAAVEVPEPVRQDQLAPF